MATKPVCHHSFMRMAAALILLCVLSGLFASCGDNGVSATAALSPTATEIPPITYTTPYPTPFPSIHMELGKGVAQTNDGVYYITNPSDSFGRNDTFAWLITYPGGIETSPIAYTIADNLDDQGNGTVIAEFMQPNPVPGSDTVGSSVPSLASVLPPGTKPGILEIGAATKGVFLGSAEFRYIG